MGRDVSLGLGWGEVAFMNRRAAGDDKISMTTAQNVTVSFNGYLRLRILERLLSVGNGSVI